MAATSADRNPTVEAQLKSREAPQRTPLDVLKDRHDELLGKAIRNGREYPEKVRNNAFLSEVEGLLEEMDRLSQQAESFAEYRWLTDAAIKWQVVFSSTLNLPKTIQLSPPCHPLNPQLPSQSLSEEEIEHWLSRNADYFAFVRIAGASGLIGSIRGREQHEQDSHLAKVFFASDVLDGKINFAARIAPASYWRLEDVWLEDVKLLRAYFLWEQRGRGYDDERKRDDYYTACKVLRRMMVNIGIKAQVGEFTGVKKYVEDRYLTDGRFLSSKPDAFNLIAKKAQRIAQVTGEQDNFKNWCNAETYATLFYENVIPAILDDDNDRVLMVLKAFQFSRTEQHHFWVINALEVAIFTYFVKAETVHLLWAASANDPVAEAPFHAAVTVPSWPSEFEIPPDCVGRFSYNEKQIAFEGVMNEQQKKSLIGQLTQETHRRGIDELYRQTRSVREDTTL